MILVFIAAGSCRSVEKNQKKPEDLDSLAAQKLGDANEIQLNASGDFALCQQKPKADHPHRSFKYIVVRVSDNSIVTEGYFNSGYVKWYNADSIEVYSVSGAVKSESGSKKIINVTSRQ